MFSHGTGVLDERASMRGIRSVTTDVIAAVKPVSYTHLDVYKRQEDKGSFRVFVGGKWSPKCPLIFCSVTRN